ncbi:MAG TPA: hypothetical protein VNO43_06190 [Candidatus Eisenbacteria bacterium]|nr:hypothetical protein [Candidatus Eisenbacteria bacterium]
MRLRTHPKITWQNKAAWEPASWSWMSTIESGTNQAAGEIERRGRLISVRAFKDKKSGAAIELLVGFEKAVFSAVMRLDDPGVVPDLLKILESLHGCSLLEIGNAELARISSRPVLKLKDGERASPQARSQPSSR